MTYKATLKVNFDSEFINHSSYGVCDDEIIPEEHYTFEIPCEDINCVQLFRFFGTIARTMGHCDYNVMRGACSLAFNDMRTEEDMRKVANEYDMTLNEDLKTKFKEWQELENDIDLNNKINRVSDNVEAMYWKSKYISELANQGKLENHSPESHQYTDEELEAMCDAAVQKQKLDIQQQNDLIGLD